MTASDVSDILATAPDVEELSEAERERLLESGRDGDSPCRRRDE